MNIRAKFEGSDEKEGHCYLIFTIDKWLLERFKMRFTKEEELYLTVSKRSEKRSLEQNRCLWALLTEIDEKVNGTRDPWQWYLNAIRRTGAKTKVIYMQEESLDELKEMCMDRNGVIRAVEPVGMADGMYAYRIFYGSSKFDTKEMSLLIDVVLDMAVLAGIDTYEWEALLKDGEE